MRDSTPLLSTPYVLVPFTATMRCSPGEMSMLCEALTKWLLLNGRAFPAASSIEYPVKSMSAVPVFKISTHSPPGQVALSNEGHGLAMTSVMMRSPGIRVLLPVAVLTSPGVGLLVAIQLAVALLGSCS